MAEITTIPAARVRSRYEPATEARDARRVIGLERQYRCTACGCERRSWARLQACPDCGEAFVSAVIRRAAFAAYISPTVPGARSASGAERRLTFDIGK